MIPVWEYISRTAGQTALDWINNHMPMHLGSKTEIQKWQAELVELVNGRFIIFVIPTGVLDFYGISQEDREYFALNLAGEFKQIQPSEILVAESEFI